jgi:hypothetical protein
MGSKAPQGPPPKNQRPANPPPAPPLPHESSLAYAARTKFVGEVIAECASCEEGIPRDDCPQSKRPCGHHCNCSWTQDVCCWCGKEFDEEPDSATT